MPEKLIKEVRFLKIYAILSSALLAGLVFIGARQAAQKTRFGEIDVERINIVEPDGTYRMIISDRTRFPGLIIKGKEYPHDRQTAGALFFNDEGTENGGLIFGGKKEKDGTTSSYGHLSFDAYEQDQVFTIDAGHEGTKRRSGLAVIDRPDYPIVELIDLMERLKGLSEDRKKEEAAKFEAAHPRPQRRLYLGRIEDDSVGLRLLDLQGRERILIQVAGDGSPAIKFLDAQGKVVSQLPAK